MRRGTTRQMVILWVGLAILMTVGFSASAGVDETTFTWGYAPNVYGSPEWAPWWQNAKDNIAGGSFTQGSGGSYPGTHFFLPVDETVYSFADLGTRIHWIYQIPDATLAEVSGLFEVKWVVDWEGEDWTTDASGAWILDDPGEGWSAPRSWEEYNGDVFGSVAFAWWGAYGYTSDTPEARAQLEADLQTYWDAQTHATGLVRWRSDPSSPWTVEQIRLILMPQSLYERLTQEPQYVIGGDSPYGFLDRGLADVAGAGGAAGDIEPSAAYTVGETITGCILVTDPSGNPVNHTYFPLTFYKVTVGGEFETREALFARTLSCWGHPGEFCFEIGTDELEPGYYDIRLGLPGGDVQWIRIELVAGE